MYKRIAGILFLICSLGVKAQKGVFNQPVMPGPNGVLVFAMDASRKNQRPDLSKTYIISRTDKKSNGYKKLATLSFPASAAELEKRMGASLLNEIVRQRKLKSTADLYAQLQAGHLDTLSIYMATPVVLEALGLLYIDKEVTQPDAQTGYKVEVGQNGTTRTLTETMLSAIRYEDFPVFKMHHRTASDSAVMVTWYAKGGHANYANIYRGANAPAGRVFVYHKGDTLFATYSSITKPGERLSLTIRATDMAGNTGSISEPVNLLALSFTNTMTIDNLKVADTLNGIKLQWDRLPNKAFYTGIRVMKSRSATDAFIVVDTLPITAITWTDKRILPGVQYYYLLEPIIYELPQHTAVTPARISAMASSTMQTVLAPQGVLADYTENYDIKIKWQPNGELNLFAYYVLRGTSRNNLKVVSPAIRDTVFIDSIIHLNAGSGYVYAVMAMDMNMRNSDTSALVGIEAQKARGVQSPAGLAARYTEQGVKLFWNNVGVTGYVLYKRKKGEQEFMPVIDSVLKGTYYTDTAISQPGIYEYGCASMDAFGNQSILSSLAEVSVSGRTYLYPPADFNLRNLTAGIEVNVPATINNAASYTVYRRISTGKWQKLGEVRNNVYVDKQVTKAQLYVYAVSATQPGMESEKSSEKSIRRK